MASAFADVPLDLSFSAKLDGGERRYVIVMPDEPRPAGLASVPIAPRGHGSDRRVFVKDVRDECRTARVAAANRRMGFVAPDHRERTSRRRPAPQADLDRIIVDLKGRRRAGKVGICGGSMGGTAALTFAAPHPNPIDGVASMSGAADLVVYAGSQEAISASSGG